jgi:phosphohistidine phosphatase
MPKGREEKMKLYLVQHGKAKTKEENSDRPLTEEGKDASEKTACFAAEQAQGSVNAILHSGKTRARDTAAIMASYLCPVKGMIEKKDLLPNDDPQEWASRLSREKEDIMLVGHLPHLSKLASLLLTGTDKNFPIDFKNSGIVCLQRDDSSNWMLSWAVTPEILGE